MCGSCRMDRQWTAGRRRRGGAGTAARSRQSACPMAAAVAAAVVGKCVMRGGDNFHEVFMNISLWVRLSRIVAAIGLIVGPTVGAQQPPAAPPAAARPQLRSPEIHPDRTVTFRLMAPKALEVS